MSFTCRCCAPAATAPASPNATRTTRKISSLASLEGHAESLESVANLRRLCEQGRLDEVVDAVGRMADQKVEVPASLMSSIVDVCLRHGSEQHSRRLHELVASTGVKLDAYSFSSLRRLAASGCGRQGGNAFSEQDFKRSNANMQRTSNDGEARVFQGPYQGTPAERVPRNGMSWQTAWNQIPSRRAEGVPSRPYPAGCGRPEVPAGCGGPEVRPARLHPLEMPSSTTCRQSPVAGGRPSSPRSQLGDTPGETLARPLPTGGKGPLSSRRWEEPTGPSPAAGASLKLEPWNDTVGRIRPEPVAGKLLKLHPGPYGRHFLYNKKNPEIIQRVFSEEDRATICWSTSKSVQDEADMILADPFWTPDSHDDRVQFKMRKILEEIYEPEFLPCSHGFRPGFSQLSCLKQVRRDFQGSVWFIGADLSKQLSCLSHPVLLKLLKRKIHDPLFVSLVQKGLKWGKLSTVITSGASAEALQTCAPILTNIALHDLDKFCMRLKRIVDRGKLIDGRLMSWRTIQTATEAPFESTEKYKPLRLEAAKVLQDGYSRRIHYVRFGNEILSGIVGPHALAKRLVALFIRFLKLRLQLVLTEDDFEITRAKGEKVPFLGYLIGRNPDFGEKLVHYEEGEKRVDKVFKPGKLVLVVDKKKVIRRLAEKGFCTKGGEPRPNFKYFQMPQSESVFRVGQILKGLADYYNLAESKKKAILYFHWIVRSSLAKTFAAKFKLRSQRKVYKRGTRDLSRPIARQSGSRKKNTYIPDSERPEYKKGKYRGRQMTGLPFTRLRQIPKPDTKPLPKSWSPRGR